MIVKVISRGELLAHLDAAEDVLLRLDFEFGPRAKETLLRLALQPDGLSESHIADVVALADDALEMVRTAAGHIVQVNPPIDGNGLAFLDDVEERLIWLGTSIRRASPGGQKAVLIAALRFLVSSEPKVRAVTAAIRAEIAARQVEPLPVGAGRKPGPRTSVPSVVRRMVELMAARPGAEVPDREVARIIKAEFGRKLSLETLQRYYRDRGKYLSGQP